MSTHVHDPLPSTAPSTAAADWSPGAAPYVHRATTVIVERIPQLFDVMAEPRTGRILLIGELDLAGRRRLRDAITVIVACASAEVVVDLLHLRFIDAGGIGLLIELRNELARCDTTLRIVNADARIGRVFAICGLDAMLSSGA